MSDRQQIIAANWKMYKTSNEAEEFFNTLASQELPEDVAVWLAAPFTLIHTAASLVEGTSILIGAQNMHEASEGAYTGEISSRMLLDAGAQFVLLGHSERRHVFGESEEMIRAKLEKALAEGPQALLCVGEGLEARQSGQTNEVLTQQLTSALKGLKPKQITVAYEPVWAIGTGETATPEIAQEAHAHCRSVLKKLLGARAAKGTSILYGGSVKPKNAATLMEQADIDGLLVGGASLNATSFSQIINFNK